MNQEEEIVFSFAKYKAALKKYFYVVIICVVLSIAYVGIAILKMNAINSQLNDTSQDITVVQEIQPTGEVYFKKSAYISVDWSEKYPEPQIALDSLIEDQEKITNIVSDYIQIEKNTLSNCAPIVNYKIFEDQVNEELKQKEMTMISDTDYIGVITYSEKQYAIYVYSQSSVERIDVLLDAAMNSFIKIAEDNYNIGKSGFVSYSETTISTKNADGSYSDKNTKAEEYIKNKSIKKISDDSNVVLEDADNTEGIPKKVLIIGLFVFFLGFIIVGVIALFDKRIYTIDEADGLCDIRVLGKISSDNNILVERLKNKMGDIKKIAVITIDTELEGQDEEQIKNWNINAENFVYGEHMNQTCLGGYKDAVVFIRRGVDTYEKVKKVVDELNMDSINIIGYIWKEK